MSSKPLLIAALALVPLLAVGDAWARQVRPRKGTTLRRPTHHVRVSGALLPVDDGAKVAAWVRLPGRPAAVAAVMWRGDQEPGGERLELRLFQKSGRQWLVGPTADKPVTLCDAPRGCTSIQVDPKPRIARVGADLVLVTTRAVTTCQSGQDACPALDHGAVFDVAASTPRRLAVFPFEAYTGEAPASREMRHQIFAFDTRFEDLDRDGGVDLRLTPSGRRIVRERRGTWVATRRRVKKRSRYALDFMRTADGYEGVHRSIGAWARAPVEALRPGAHPGLVTKAVREVVQRLEWAFAMRRLETGDEVRPPRGFHWGYACLVADDTGAGPSCSTRGLRTPELMGSELPAVARAARLALLKLPPKRRDRRLDRRLQEMAGQQR